jgi:aspartyl-tRNA(Asn)/glutamyl-tRNA(Gln) amidotransferase subunit A
MNPAKTPNPIRNPLQSIEAFAAGLRAGSISALEATEECLRAIESGDHSINAFVRVMTDEARRDARRADADIAAGIDRGPLHGVPISIKDLVDIAGVPTTASSRIREGHIADADAPIIAALRKAGAVVIGKTNLHEFAFGTTTEDSAFGPTRNPVDGTRSPGGSSGGSAASIVAGMSLASIGTDTGGSIRIPAAACGTVGLKPTTGEVSTDGVVPLSRTLDHVGPLAKTVTDAWLIHRALAGQTRAPATLDGPQRVLRLGVPRKYFCDRLDGDVRQQFEDALAAARAAGAMIDDVEITHAEWIATVYLHIVFADAAAYHATALDTMPERYTPPVRVRLETARYVLAEDYVRALIGRRTLRAEVDRALEGRDALVLPTLPIPAPKIGAEMVNVGGSDEPVRNVMLRLTQLFNITGHPAVSLPCGVTSEGMPVGLQLVGAHHRTRELLGVARAIEKALEAGS